MSIFEAQFTVAEQLGDVEINIEAHDRGTVCLLMELVTTGGPNVLAEMSESQAFELGVALIRASTRARQALLNRELVNHGPVDEG